MKAGAGHIGGVLGAGSCEADIPGTMLSLKEMALYDIRIGQERFEIPDEVALGGYRCCDSQLFESQPFGPWP